MLLTICPNCAAQFKVQPEQLNVRQGRVMCGRCRQVFNAFQALSRVEETNEKDVIELPPTELEHAQHEENPLRFSATDATTEAIAGSLFLREEPAPLPAAFSASGPVSRDDIAADATSPLFAEGATESSHPEAGDSKGVSRPVSRPDASETATPAIDLSETENPLLAEESVGRTMPLSTVSRVWGVGAFMLFTVLLAQTAFAFRTLLVASYPELRPAASQICELAGCTLSWGRDETALKIEASELIEAPGKPGRILLTAILVNRGKTKQDLPSLELRLTDNANQVIVSRLLHPRDYLGRAIAKDDGLVPNTELYVNVNLSVEPNNKPPASGYGLVVFYP